MTRRVDDAAQHLPEVLSTLAGLVVRGSVPTASIVVAEQHARRASRFSKQMTYWIEWKAVETVLVLREYDFGTMVTPTITGIGIAGDGRAWELKDAAATVPFSTASVQPPGGGYFGRALEVVHVELDPAPLDHPKRPPAGIPWIDDYELYELAIATSERVAPTASRVDRAD